MRYSNDSAGAIAAMESMRTGNYGEDYAETESEYCPICGAEADYLYETDDGDVVGCDWCLTRRSIYDN